MQAGEVGGHAAGFLGRKFGEVGPGVEAGVVAVVEADAKSVAADRFGANNTNMALADRRGRAGSTTRGRRLGTLRVTARLIRPSASCAAFVP
jgi:hypothetical protein